MIFGHNERHICKSNILVFVRAVHGMSSLNEEIICGTFFKEMEFALDHLTWALRNPCTRFSFS